MTEQEDEDSTELYIRESTRLRAKLLQGASSEKK